MDLESPAAAAPGRTTVCVMRRLSRYYFAIKNGAKAGRTHVKGHGFLSFVMSHVGEEKEQQEEGKGSERARAGSEGSMQNVVK